MNPNKKICKTKTVDTFILNKNSIEEFEQINPITLIIIYTNFIFDNIFFNCINNLNPHNKTNTIKIITSDLVISKYFYYLDKKINELFFNFKTLVINSFDNSFLLVSDILDDLEIMNVEYNLDYNIHLTNSIYLYDHFFDKFFHSTYKYLKNITIKNNICNDLTNLDTVEIKIINNLITMDKIKNKNKKVFNFIKNWEPINKYFIYYDNSFDFYYQIYNLNNINLLNLKYIDMKNNIVIQCALLNIKEDNLY